MSAHNDGRGILPSREQLTAFQINTLLGVMATLQNYLIRPPSEYGATIESETAAAAQLTFWKVCDRLQEVLADASRWDLAIQSKIEAAVAENLAQQAAYLKASTESAAEVKRPYFIHRPKLVRSEVGWHAIYGDTTNLDSCIIGTGASPEEACASFDEAFRTKVDMIMPLEDIAPAPEPKPRRKKKE